MAKRNTLPISSFDDYQAALGQIAKDLLIANTHLQLIHGINARINDLYEAMNDAKTFWGTTVFGHYTSCVTTLYCAFDTHSGTVSFPNLLDTIIAHIEDNNASEATSQLPKDDLWSMFHDREHEVLADRRQLKSITHNLMIVRNNEVGHRNYQRIIVEGLIENEQWIDELTRIIDQGFTLADRYGSFGMLRLTNPRSFPDVDNYLNVLDAIKAYHDRLVSRESADSAINN